MVTIMARSLGAAAALAVVLVLLTAGGCAARDFYVGGRDGWTPNPGEPHNRWAERNRFHVNDTLVFRYDKAADDGVLHVTQNDYDTCNTSQPLLRLTGGDSRFLLPNSGPYFFISADAGLCKAGERLIVVVLAIRDKDFRNMPSPLFPSSPPPPPPKSSSAPPPAQPKPGPPSLSTPPPPPTPHALPPAPPSAGNASSPSAAPWTAPLAGTNGNCEPTAPSTSSAVALRAGILACFFAAALL